MPGHFPVMMQKSLYNKMPTVTRNKVRRNHGFFGDIGSVRMEVFGLDPEVGCIVMMERPLRTLEVKRIRN